MLPWGKPRHRNTAIGISVIVHMRLALELRWLLMVRLLPSSIDLCISANSRTNFRLASPAVTTLQKFHVAFELSELVFGVFAVLDDGKNPAEINSLYSVRTIYLMFASTVDRRLVQHQRVIETRFRSLTSWSCPQPAVRATRTTNFWFPVPDGCFANYPIWHSDIQYNIIRVGSDSMLCPSWAVRTSLPSIFTTSFVMLMRPVVIGNQQFWRFCLNNASGDALGVWPVVSIKIGSEIRNSTLWKFPSLRTPTAPSCISMIPRQDLIEFDLGGAFDLGKHVEYLSMH